MLAMIVRHRDDSGMTATTDVKPQAAAQRQPYDRAEVPTALGLGPAAFQDPDVQRFLHQGYLVIDQAIDQDTVIALRSALDGVASRRPGQEIIHSLLEEDDRFATLLEVPAVMSRLTAILGTCMQLHSATARITTSGHPDQDWHRDGPWPMDPVGVPYGGIPAQINCGFYLDIEPEMGAFVCLPGSHRAPFRPPKGHAPFPDEIHLVPRPGQAVLFDGWLFHRGGANRSNGVRRTCLMCYQHAWMKSRERFDGPRVAQLRATGTARTRLLLGGVSSW
ncbi:hypothetical protein LBMAG53_20970 [Planctomycetota bacterium]|nr:hypothetical protein LBMAG53_20970 [Planctomycetota bacterium]